jgi:hypothetical protein
VEFVTLLSSEANDIAEREAKKTIACEHVVSALKQLGYPDYIGDISKVAQEHKTQQAVRRPLPVDSELTSAVSREEALEIGTQRTDRGRAHCPARGAVQVRNEQVPNVHGINRR